MQKTIVLVTLLLHGQIYGWPEVSIAKETQEFLARQVATLTTSLPKNFGQELNNSVQTAHRGLHQTVDTASSELVNFSDSLTKNLKSIPIMGLGFVAGFYALQSLKNNMQELSQAIEDHDQEKQKKHIAWGPFNIAILIASLLVITKSDTLVAMLA